MKSALSAHSDLNYASLNYAKNQLKEIFDKNWCILILDIEDRNLFLDEYTPGLDTGFTVEKNGTGFVANSTVMPGVTAEMFDWWFGWHSVVSELRYKLWDKEDHFYARADNPEYVLDRKRITGCNTFLLAGGIINHISQWNGC